MTSTDPYVYVDDNDWRVKFSDNWGQSNASAAYNGTLHYATPRGATVTFSFNGTFVAVIGGQGDTSSFGWPSTSYAIDGNVQSTYNLATGDHALTWPNTYWFDYIQYLPSDSTTTSISSTSTSTSTSAAHTQTPPKSSGTSDSGSSANTGSPASSSSRHSTNIGAVIGGAIGGAVLVAIIGIIAVYLYLKRKARAEQGGDVFGKMHYDAPVNPYFSPPNQSIPFLPGSPSLPPSDWSEPRPGTPSVTPFQGSAASSSSRTTPPVVRHPTMRKDRSYFMQSQPSGEPSMGAGESSGFSRAESVAEFSAAGSSSGYGGAHTERAGTPVLSPSSARSPTTQEVDSGYRVPVAASVVTSLPPPYTPD
ncbi:hypothetical protein ONZ51_g9989 [Trametes cubensis]|uniref:Transmembrane protein n=1 Tax=Trametes cubensis TaxID=1111947 RepID=A0AAD7TM60_9APHY|nr:hypothetical protein ONZ51_g9989 [Trametes cubensis]